MVGCSLEDTYCFHYSMYLYCCIKNKTYGLLFSITESLLNHDYQAVKDLVKSYISDRGYIRKNPTANLS
jgi:hypothetical protein